MALSEKHKHDIEAVAGMVCLAALIWWILHQTSQAAPAATDTTDPTGESAQPNIFTPATFTPAPFDVTINNLQYPLSVGSGGNFPLYLNIPLVEYTLAVPQVDCDCGTGTNCPVSPSSIASLQKMETLGVAYGNAMIQAANDTQEAILQNFANQGQNVYYINNGVGQ